MLNPEMQTLFFLLKTIGFQNNWLNPLPVSKENKNYKQPQACINNEHAYGCFCQIQE